MTTIQFWISDPSELLNKEHMTEIWPNSEMSYEQKMNAISRIIILVTIIGFIFIPSIRILLIGIFTLAAIIFLYFHQS